MLQLLLSPATPSLAASCKQHSSRLRGLAASAVESAEDACMAHMKANGELSPTAADLQEKVSKAAYAAAAVDGLTAQVQSFNLFGSRFLQLIIIDINCYQI